MATGGHLNDVIFNTLFDFSKVRIEFKMIRDKRSDLEWSYIILIINIAIIIVSIFYFSSYMYLTMQEKWLEFD